MTIVDFAGLGLLLTLIAFVAYVLFCEMREKKQAAPLGSWQGPSKEHWNLLVAQSVRCQEKEILELIREYEELGGKDLITVDPSRFPDIVKGISSTEMEDRGWTYGPATTWYTPERFVQGILIPLRAKKYQELRVEIDRVGVAVSSVLKSAEQRSRKKGGAK